MKLFISLLFINKTIVYSISKHNFWLIFLD